MKQFDDENEIEETVIEEDTIKLTREEVEALLRECKYSYISYENPVAREVISRLLRWIE